SLVAAQQRGMSDDRESECILSDRFAMMEFLPNASHVMLGMIQVGQNPHDELGLLTAHRARLIWKRRYSWAIIFWSINFCTVLDLPNALISLSFNIPGKKTASLSNGLLVCPETVSTCVTGRCM